MNDDFNTMQGIQQDNYFSTETGAKTDVGTAFAIDSGIQSIRGMDDQAVQGLMFQQQQIPEMDFSRSEELNRAYDAFIEASVADRNSASTPILIACVVLAMLCMPLISMIVEWFMK